MRLDNGRNIEFIPIPKPLAKKLRETKLSERERKLIDVIIEQTFGYQAFKDGNESVRRTSKALSSRYLVLLTDFPRSTVNYEIERLEKRNILNVGEVWFKGQKTKDIGLNLDVKRWDKTTNRISQKEYAKLHKQAKELVKLWWKEINPTTSTPDWEIVEGKRRDKTDLIMYKRDSRIADVSVIVKVSWGETINWDYLNVPDKPKTAFCFVNRPMTMMALIQPYSVQDLEPKDGYYRVPREVDSQGRNRIRIKILASETEMKLDATSMSSGAIYV